MIDQASKTQYMDLPSVNLSELRERGIVVRCANFSVEALRSDRKLDKVKKVAPLLPVVTSDKKTFNIPEDVYNPAFQVSITLYHYPDKCGNKFLCKLIYRERNGETERGWRLESILHVLLLYMYIPDMSLALALDWGNLQLHVHCCKICTTCPPPHTHTHSTCLTLLQYLVPTSTSTLVQSTSTSTRRAVSG